MIKSCQAERIKQTGIGEGDKIATHSFVGKTKKKKKTR